MNKIYKTAVTALLLLLLFVQHLHAQNKYVLPQISPKSPNAAEFEKYGNIPVSLTSGMVNLSIPLYTIKVGSLVFPITLSYNSNGLKTDEIPSYVGMGWSINTGGVINYEQRSLPDYSIAGGPGMFTEASDLNALDSLKLFLKNQMTAARANKYLQKVTEGEIDGEFDLYHYTFPGYSGTFYSDTNQNIITIPKTNLNIKRVNGNLYTILDEKGNKWTFGVADYNQCNPVQDAGVQMRQTFNENGSIFMQQVTTNDNRSITFGYAPNPFTYVKESTSVDVMSDNGTGGVNCPGSRINTNRSEYSLTNNLLTEIYFDGGKVLFELSTEAREDIKALNPFAYVRYLKKLKIYNVYNKLITEYTFNYTNGNRLRLDEVVRTDTSGTPAKWSFSYIGGNTYPQLMDRRKDHWGFYNGGAAGIPNGNYSTLVPGWVGNSTTVSKEASFNHGKTGLLEKVTYPTGGSSFFTYEGNTITFTDPSQLSSRSFLRLNGFANQTVNIMQESTADGQDVIQGSFTLPVQTTVDIVATRWYKPINQINSLVILTKPPSSTNITGSTYGWQCGAGVSCSINKTNVSLAAGTYNYSLYKYADDSGFWLDGLANLRVSTQVQEAEFTYPLGGCRIASIKHTDSVGNYMMQKYKYETRYEKVGYFNTPYYISQSRTWVNNFAACVLCGVKSTISEESVAPMSGPPVEYLNVTEYTDDNGNNGYTNYTYTSNTNLHTGNGPYLSAFKTNWKAGQLLNKATYKKTPDTTVLLQLDSTAYETVAVNTGITRGLKAEYSDFCPLEGVGNRYFSYQLPTYQTEIFNNKSQSSIYYDSVGKLASTSENIYGSAKHTKPTEIRTTTSDGATLKELIKYSFDYDTTTISGNEAKGIRLLQRKNILVPIEKTYVKSIGGVDHVTKGILFCYKADTAVLDRVFELALNAPAVYSGFATSGITAGNLTKDSRYDESARFTRYDENLNVLQMQLSNNVIKSYLWDYNRQYPICEVVGAEYGDFAYTSFETLSPHGEDHEFWHIGDGFYDSTVALTGRMCFNNFSAGPEAKYGLKVGKKYVVSYWSDAGPAILYGGNGTVTSGANTNGWTYWEHLITTYDSAVAIVTDGRIDELRLYPYGAQMTTFTYSPSIGITSQCDSRNNATHYEYDNQNRLLHIRDYKRNVIKKMKYTYQSNSLIP